MNKFLKSYCLNHPTPSESGVSSLYKYLRVRTRASSPQDHLECLLVDGQLYHSIAGKLNDPFECKPKYRFTYTGQEVKDVIAQIEKLGMKYEGWQKSVARKRAKERVAKTADGGRSLIADIRRKNFR